MINETNTKRICCEDISKIENYEKAIADSSQTWVCHHRLGVQGEFLNSVELLKKCGIYYGVTASQLIFLTQTEHKRIHGVVNHIAKNTKNRTEIHKSTSLKR